MYKKSTNLKYGEVVFIVLCVSEHRNGTHEVAIYDSIGKMMGGIPLAKYSSDNATKAHFEEAARYVHGMADSHEYEGVRLVVVMVATHGTADQKYICKDGEKFDAIYLSGGRSFLC